MRLTAKVIKVLPEQSGVSERGPWRKASYVIEERTGINPNTLVVDVHDGQTRRIDMLNIQEGQTYEFFLDAHVSEYNGRFYNNIKAYGANPVPDPKELNPTTSEGPIPPDGQA